MVKSLTTKDMALECLHLQIVVSMKVSLTMTRCKGMESSTITRKILRTKVISIYNLGQFFKGSFHGHGVLYNNDPKAL